MRVMLARILACVIILRLPHAAVVIAAESETTVTIDLRGALNEALRHSPQLLPSEDAVTTAGIQRTLAVARFAPKISPMLSTGTAPMGLSQQNLGLGVSQLLQTGAQVQASANSVRYGSGPGEFRDAGYSIGISQPLLRGFGATTRAPVDAASAAADGAERSAADARQQLVVAVAHAYFAVVRQQRLTAESERVLERASELSEMSEARARVGLSTQLDVFRAGLLRSQAQSAVLGNRDALDAAREDLNLLLGRPTDAPIVADVDVSADLHALEETAGQPDVPTALADRLDVRGARARLTEAQHDAALAKWNLLPQLNLDVSYTRRGLGTQSTDSFANLFNGWRIGLGTTYSFDHATDAAAAGLAQVAVRAAERGVSETEQRAIIDVRRATRASARAADVLALSRTSLDLAGQQRELATLRWERGLADNLEVIDAETRVFQAQSALIAADIDRALAFLTLQRASGALDPNRFLQ